MNIAERGVALAPNAFGAGGIVASGAVKPRETHNPVRFVRAIPLTRMATAPSLP
jgi:hypothetical protein